MNNLCVSAASSALANPDDRYEVAVQSFLSCNSATNGCDGGMAADASSAMKKLGGVIKERDFKYKCGGGDPHDHFAQDSATCKAAPWGASCPAGPTVPGWNFYGHASVNGEGPMMTLMAQGQALYVSFKVADNFMNWKDGVYTTPSGKIAGGHAVAGVGYGVEAGTKYWILQNSWGPGGSGVNGFVKFLRGTDFLGVETNAAHLIGWVTGGRLPTCRDGEKTGYTAGGEPIPCAEAPDYDLCSVDSVRSTCPETCNACPGVDYPPPTPAPTPAPAVSGDACVTPSGTGGCTMTTNCVPARVTVLFECYMGSTLYHFSGTLPGRYTYDYTASGCDSCPEIMSVTDA